MAEEIEISNVGGANGVASEATLKALVDALNKKDGTGKSGKEAEKFNNALKSGVTVVSKNTDSITKGTKATKSATQATGEFAKKLKGAAFGAIGAIAGSIGNLGKEFINGGSQLGDFTQHLPLIGSAIAPLVGVIDDSIRSFRQLSSIGAGFNNNITEMRYAAAEMGLTLNEMTDFVSQNSETMLLFGNTVQDGFQNFRNVNRELKDIGEWQQLKNLGFTVEDINEGLASYGQLQMRMGRLQNLSTRQLAAESANYLKQMNMLAKVTGKSREELENQQAALAQDAAFRALAANLQGEALTNFQASMGIIENIDNEKIKAGLKDLADGVAQTPEGIALLNQAGPEIQAVMQRVAQGADPQILIDALGRAGSRIEANNRAMGAAALTGIGQINAEYKGVADGATELINIGRRNINAAETQANAQDAATQELVSFDDKIREVRSAIQKALIDSGLFDNLAGLMANLASGLGAVIPDIVTWLTDFANIAKEGGFGAAIEEKILQPMKDSIMDGLTKLWEDNKIIGSIVGALGALFVGSRVVGALTSGVRGLFGGGGGGGGGDGGGSRGRGRGGGGGNAVSKFLGGATEGLLTGTAKGIAAFADPRIPIGAAALGAAVVAIGAGVAGAAWIMGNALPTFAEGMKSFEDLDGAKLEAAGSGMVSVGAGFAAFGAGGVAAGIGGIIGGISEGLVGLFGGDDPLTKIKKFGDADIDGVKVKANAEAMIAFGEAMQSAGVGNAAAGAGGIVGAIGSFFADDPTEQVKEFGALNINADGVTNNANAMLIMAQAIRGMSSSGISTLEIPDGVIEGFEKLSRIGTGLGTTATSLTTLAGITNLEPNVTLLNSLDRTGIRNYNNELERMVELLEAMNTELAKDNNGWSAGTGTNAGTALSAMGSSGGGSSELSSSMLAVLEEIRDTNVRSQRLLDDIARNV